MASLFFLRSALRPHWLITVLLLGLTGCESEPSRRHGPPPDSAPPEAPAPEMQAQAVFFDGQVEVEIVLNRNGFALHGGEGGSGGGGPGPGGGGRGGGGGGRGGRRSRGGGGDPGAGGGPSSSGDDPAPNIHASNEAPVRFHLRLTNHGTAPVDVEVVDFNSELGNFVVQPEKISLPPGQSVEADPMISRLGVRSAEIPLVVRLRANGKMEMQTLNLHTVEPPPLRIAPTGTPAPTSTPTPSTSTP